MRPEVVRSPIRDLEVIVDVPCERWLHSRRTASALLLRLVEVGEDRMSYELWPEFEDLHPVRIEFSDGLSLWTQETEVVLSDRTFLVFLVKTIPSNPSDGERARWTREGMISRCNEDAAERAPRHKLYKREGTSWPILAQVSSPLFDVL
jgi:hypothetical protein